MTKVRVYFERPTSMIVTIPDSINLEDDEAIGDWIYQNISAEAYVDDWVEHEWHDVQG